MSGDGSPSGNRVAPRGDRPAYAVGWLRDVRMGPDIAEYLRRIDGTLAPFGGRFIIHGGRAAVLEGRWDADLIVIAFPSAEAAHAWYVSEDYRALIPLRLRNSHGAVAIIEGTDPDHKATDILRDNG
ncbi:DUF1330 domain-containing protein [Acuticoccus sediminis]|uniref:DUF1330 domain-containing protein n=1 Tax=Acuticoccus sediminis TaxID=2184697 RepID=UPI001CFCE6CC|nr:DUF1330 domain-containing protein [Acuticoccus sediminis]